MFEGGIVSRTRHAEHWHANAVPREQNPSLEAYQGAPAQGPGRIYLVGGASAVLMGWRGTTSDVDLKLHPEPAGIFEAIAKPKDELGLNVELVAPDDFIPPLPGWQARSRFIAAHGGIDFYAQALAKIGHGHGRDLDDVQMMQRYHLIDTGILRELFTSIEPSLIRYPQIEPRGFRRRVHDILRNLEP